MRLLRGCTVVLTALCLLVPVSAGSDTAVVPILMYHHFTLDPTRANGNCITADAFDGQLAALSDAGYHSVTVADCFGFVD